MKRIRKCISFILTIMIIFNSVIPVSASENITSLNVDAKNHMLRILASIEDEKEYYGLETVDFSKIQLGTEIPTYRVFEGCLIKADIRLIPIVNNEKILSFFYIAADKSGEIIVQLSNELVVPLSKHINKTSSVALIYDSDGVYLYDGADLCLIGLNEQNTSIAPVLNTKSRVDNYDSITSIAFKKIEEINRTNYLSAVNELDVASFKINFQESVSRVIMAHYLSVDIITQPVNTNICWAIALTSIINYVWDSNWSYSDIVDMFTGGVDKPLTTREVVSNFNYWFSTDWSYIYTSQIEPTVILNYLYAGYPIYGLFERPNADIAHAVVIRGVNTAYNTFSVMNPSPTTSGYTSGTISSTNVLTFISGYNGNTFTLCDYAFPIIP